VLEKLQQFEDELQQRKRQSLYRSRLLVNSAAGTEIDIEGERLLTFCSNDYLGLANHPELKKAFISAVQRWGVGSGSAHLVTGHSSVHHQLEEELADFTGRQKALLFSSGYMANLGLITVLAEKGDHVFEDRLNHASLIDGGKMSAARLHRYLHADVSSLQRQLAGTGAGDKLIATDGVFSMDGDIAPLPDIVKTAENARAMLMVDDAHGIGVLGPRGGGSLEYFELSPQQVPILMGTLGKSLGCAGAFVAGDESLVEMLIQKARSYIYTTAQPAAVAEAARVALKISINESWRRDRLFALIKRFRYGAMQLGLPLMESFTPIQPLLAGTAEQAITWANQLKQIGIVITAIRPPTVPEGTARLRITFSADHTELQVDQLLEALGQLKTVEG